jgi:hypothetical protein
VPAALIGVEETAPGRATVQPHICAITPSPLQPETQEAISGCTEQAAHALGLVHGPLHEVAQVLHTAYRPLHLVITPEGQLLQLERRPPASGCIGPKSHAYRPKVLLRRVCQRC